MITSVLGEPLPASFHSTLPSMLPMENSGISMICCQGPKAQGKFWGHLCQESQQWVHPTAPGLYQKTAF